MSITLAYSALLISLVLGAAVLLQARRSFASWCFFAGMTVFGVECLFQGLSIQSSDRPTFVFWQGAVWLTKSLLPGIWLAFSLSYSRGNYREFLSEWRFGLTLAAILPPAIALCFFHGLVLPPPKPAVTVQWLALSLAGKSLNVLLLVGILLVLANFERTFQDTVGTMRWRVKFALLGLSMIFGARIYTHSLALLFSRQDFSAIDVETGSLLFGCAMIGIAHLRRGFSDVDVYPSHAFLRNSVTLVLAGGYLFAVGVLAQTAKWLGGSSAFQWQVLVTLGGVAGLGVLVLSERLRQRIKYFVSHHLRRPHHDFRQVWRELTGRLASAHNATESCIAAAQMISETFNALSVTIWLADDERRWILGASTGTRDRVDISDGVIFEATDLAEITSVLEPFDLEQASSNWAGQLRAMTQQQFSSRTRLAVVLRASQRVLGIAVLGDRVNRISYTVEELELLKCLADQLAVGLLNFCLSREIALARELETFQTMSAFFVHDLKNSASSLNLMLENLPRHFDNPEFREDALRGLARTTGHINNLITRLSSFREQLELSFSQTDLDKLIAEVIDQIGPRPILLSKELKLMQPLLLDREHIKSVVTNLIANAHEATPSGGSIHVKTEKRHAHAVLTVSDSGCGMSMEFVQRSLFRPFQTTKKRGIGIGMFQARMIVEAHRGHIHVESAPLKGTTFQVTLPL